MAPASSFLKGADWSGWSFSRWIREIFNLKSQRSSCPARVLLKTHIHTNGCSAVNSKFQTVNWFIINNNVVSNRICYLATNRLLISSASCEKSKLEHVNTNLAALQANGRHFGRHLVAVCSRPAAAVQITPLRNHCRGAWIYILMSRGSPAGIRGSPWPRVIPLSAVRSSRVAPAVWRVCVCVWTHRCDNITFHMSSPLVSSIRPLMNYLKVFTCLKLTGNHIIMETVGATFPVSESNSKHSKLFAWIIHVLRYYLCPFFSFFKSKFLCFKAAISQTLHAQYVPKTHFGSNHL